MSNVVPFPRAHRNTTSVLAAPAAGQHLVLFYEDQASLFETVCQFLGAGLKGGDHLVVIATPEHWEGFVRNLKGFDVEAAVAEGRLLFADARETLAKFMINGAPERDRFHQTLGGILSQATRGRKGVCVRAYGEMVDLLWQDGSRSAAILLEELWNEASSTHAFSLLCAYVMANFYRGEASGGDGPGFADVCRTHSHVILPAEASACQGSVAEPLAGTEIRDLEERVRSLELENGKLREIEKALRQSTIERLHEGEARFRLLVESVKDYAIFVLDPNGIVRTWNKGAERIKGYKAEEIIGRHFSTFYPEEDVLAGKCERELAGATEEGRFEDEGWRVRKDGSRFWANVVITPLYQPGGPLVGFAKVTRDLTERIAGEHERLQVARMEEAERRKDEFLAIMGHELRNPLAPLVTAAHMIRLRGGRATEKEMGVLDRQLRQMTKIVTDLLDASRAMRDTIELAPKIMEIGEVLANAVDLASPLIEERRHEVVIEVPERGLPVNVDPERMAQVFGNVLNNAAKYTPNGGTIRLRAARRGDDVEVTVEDNGQGIAPEMIGRIFDMFTQGSDGLERKGGGLGIGLAIARRMVREHHGQIEAASAGVGRGSRFTIRLPRAAVRPRALRTDGASMTGGPASPRRILVADDNSDAAELMQTLLEHDGHEVRVAYDGPGALQACGEFEPDAVFLDIGLPGMDGYEVAKRMRKIPGCEKIPIVAVSGYARDEDRARALASGFTDHLAKPVDAENISKTLQSSARH